MLYNRRNPKYNPQTKEAKYPFNVHHSELVRDAKVNNDAPSAFTQKLGDNYGMNIALQILNQRYSNSK